MRVVFVQYGDYGISEGYQQMMVDSCKRWGHEVWQLTDEHCPEVPGVDLVLRRPKMGGGMLFRAQHLAALDGEYVMLDSDMLVVGDLTAGLPGDCDVSLTWRKKHNVVTKDGTVLEMPYNGGVVFVRNNAFMVDCAKSMERQPAHLQEWYGDQLALRNVARSGDYLVRELKDREWNFVPEVTDEGLRDEGVRIFHFKGLMKKWMRRYYEQRVEK